MPRLLAFSLLASAVFFIGCGDPLASAAVDIAPDTGSVFDSDIEQAIQKSTDISADSLGDIAPESGPDVVAEVVADATSDTDVTEPASLPAAATLFDANGLHVIALQLDPADWKAYLVGAAQADGSKTYVWYHAKATVDGQVWADIGMRGFGNGSQLDNPKKPNIRLKFDEYELKGKGPEGVHSIRLKSSGQDRTFVREPLVYDMARSVGGFGPHYSWAEVTVNNESYGFYQLLEQAEKHQFKNLFGNSAGNKYQSSEACVGFDCPPDGCEALKYMYQGDPGDGAELADLAQAVTDSTPTTLLAVLNKRVDLDALLATYAVDALVSNLDGLAAAGQNFTLYVNDQTKLIELIMSGEDLTFGNFKNAWYDIFAPWGMPNNWCPKRQDHLYLRILASPDVQPKLLAKMRALQCGAFLPQKINARLLELKTKLLPHLVADPKGMYGQAEIEGAYTAISNYVAKRAKLLDQKLGPCK